VSARLVVIVVSLPLLAAASCSRAPGPGDAGYRYNVDGRYASDIVVRDARYAGSTQLATRAGGALSGTMTFVTPISVTAELSGAVRGDSIAFDGRYRTPDCTGVLRGRGRIADGGDSAWGRVSMDDSCVGAMAGTFGLRK
jgi:hypothetical protein